MSVLDCGKGIKKSKELSVYCKKISNNITKIISPEKKTFPKKQSKNRHRSASLTAEAAMTLPLVFYTSFILWQCFLLLLLQLAVCQKVTETALTSGSVAYLEQEAEGKGSETVYRMLLWNALLDMERMEGLQVAVCEEDDRLQVCVTYEFCCESGLFPVIRIPVKQRFVLVPYFGERAEDLCSEEEIISADVVYVTKAGTVYHESKSCVYLSVKVSAVSYEQIASKRNSSGRKYTACGRCVGEKPPEKVYISLGGERFHARADCPSLKRVVQEKDRKEVTLPACSKCGKERK